MYLSSLLGLPPPPKFPTHAHLYSIGWDFVGGGSSLLFLMFAFFKKMYYLWNGFSVNGCVECVRKLGGGVVAPNDALLHLFNVDAALVGNLCAGPVLIQPAKKVP